MFSVFCFLFRLHKFFSTGDFVRWPLCISENRKEWMKIIYICDQSFIFHIIHILCHFKIDIPRLDRISFILSPIHPQFVHAIQNGWHHWNGTALFYFTLYYFVDHVRSFWVWGLYSLLYPVGLQEISEFKLLFKGIKENQ